MIKVDPFGSLPRPLPQVDFESGSSHPPFLKVDNFCKPAVDHRIAVVVLVGNQRVLFRVAKPECLLKGRVPILTEENMFGLSPVSQSMAFFQYSTTSAAPETTAVDSLWSCFCSLVLRQRSAESITLGSGFNDVCTVGQPVHHGLAQPRIGDHLVHSENGRFVVMITAARSARPAIT